MQTGIAYEKDFFAWTEEQALLLRQGKYKMADMKNIIEEIEAMGRSEKRELRSRLTVLLKHLLKWEYQPEKRSKSRSDTLNIQREDVREVLEDNPSLRGRIPEFLLSAYPKARMQARMETGLEIFPEENPFSPEEVINPKD